MSAPSIKTYCTYVDTELLPRGLALHQSLLTQAAGAELVVLCLDAGAEAGLRNKALPGVRLLPLAELLARHPPLAAARANRTPAEFGRTCKSCLMRHLLPELAAGELLTFVNATLYFFSPPQPLYEEMRASSVGIVPHRFAGAHSREERFGKYHADWVCVRHDATGLACVADWAEKCIAWCFTLLGPGRYAEQKYLDDWPAQFPGTAIITHAGAIVAPWNMGDRAVTPAGEGPQIDGLPLISFDFGDLTHLGGQLYDPGLHAYGIMPSNAWRTLVYLPYLHQLAAQAPVNRDEPDIVPPARAGDQRCGPAVSELLVQLQAAHRDQARQWHALEKQRADARQLADDSRAALLNTKLYVNDLEHERDELRLSLITTKDKLKTAYTDLDRNISYLKRLETDRAAQAKVIDDKNVQIATLGEELNRPSVAVNQFNPVQVRAILGHSGPQFRKVLVAKFHPRLLPHLLALSAAGTPIEIFSTPPEYGRIPPGPMLLQPSSLWEWLGWINSLFSEKAYLQANPDVAAAVASGTQASGWEHYLGFGQREGRNPGAATYCSGLAEAEAVAFDDSDTAELAPCLIGRLQPHHKLLISGYPTASDWLPQEIARSELPGGLLFCAQSPASWLGPAQPTNRLAPYLPALHPQDIYPKAPSAPGSAWPKISVVTVSNNQAAPLEETIRSVLNQNYPNLEYIIVDGGSPDDSAAIIRKFASRLTSRVGEKNQGQSQALNKGFRQATGTILTWLNSNDLLAPGSLFAVAGAFLRNDADMVAGRCARVAELEPLSYQIHRSYLPLDRITPLPLEDLLDLDHRWLNGYCFLQPGVFFRREIFDRAGGQMREDLDHSMDYDLWVRLAKAGARILVVPEILAILHKHQEQKTGDGELPFRSELRAVNAAHRAAP